MRPTPSHARYTLNHQERETDSCKRRQQNLHTHTHTQSCTLEQLPPLPPSCTLCPLATLTHSHLMHIHSLSWLKQLLAFCWREPFPRPCPPLNSFSCCLYIGSQSHSTIFYIRFSIYIFSFCSVPFRYLCCHVLLALFTRRHLLYLVWYLLLVTPSSPRPLSVFVCISLTQRCCWQTWPKTQICNGN